MCLICEKRERNVNFEKQVEVWQNKISKKNKTSGGRMKLGLISYDSGLKREGLKILKIERNTQEVIRRLGLDW